VMDEARFALNRIISPDLDLEAFFKLTMGVGLKKVELRNDLPAKGIIDGLQPKRVRELAGRYGIEIITINALQKFNLTDIHSQLTEELEQLLILAESIRCRAVVLCPNNEASDERDADQEAQE